MGLVGDVRGMCTSTLARPAAWSLSKSPSRTNTRSTARRNASVNLLAILFTDRGDELERIHQRPLRNTA